MASGNDPIMDFYDYWWRRHPFEVVTSIRPPSFRTFYEANARKIYERQQIEGGNILALGSGSGEPDARVAENIRGSKLFTMDFAAVKPGRHVIMMEDMRDGKTPNPEGTQHRQVRARFESLPYADGCFHLAISSYAFGLSPGIATATKEPYRVLRPGAGAVLMPDHPVKETVNGPIKLNEAITRELRILEKKLHRCQEEPASGAADMLRKKTEIESHIRDLQFHLRGTERFIQHYNEGKYFTSKEAIRRHFELFGFRVENVASLMQQKYRGGG